MFWWSIIARACRSASKRAMTCAAVHAGLDDLERDLAADRLLLLGHVDDAHAAFADLLQQLVRADDRAGPLRDRRWTGSGTLIDPWRRRLLHEVTGLVDGLQEAFNFRRRSALAPQASSK